MRASKKAVQDIIDRLYTIEEDGEKVIRPDRLEELTQVMAVQFSNVSVVIEQYLGFEKFVVSNIGKNGIKRIFERKIGFTDNTCAGIIRMTASWKNDDVAKILNEAIVKYGKDAFSNRKKAEALCSDLLVRYEEECRIIKILFREGLFEQFESNPVRCDDEEYKRLMLRVSKFIDTFGFDSAIKENVEKILRKSFLKRDVRTNIDISKQTQNCIFYITTANTEKRELAMYCIKGNCKSGLGNFDKKGINTFDKLMNQTTDAYQYLLKHQDELNIYDIFRDKDYELEYSCVSNNNLPTEVTLPTMVYLYSLAIGKKITEGTVLVGNIDEYAELQKVQELEEILFVCKNYNAKQVVLPISCMADMVSLPQELITSMQLNFYASITDALNKMM